MKTSNKLLLGCFILITITLLAGITIIGCNFKTKTHSSKSETRTLTYEYNNLKDIKLEGAFSIEYIQEPESRIKLTIPENSENLFKINETETTFSISYKEIEHFEVRLKITAPNIKTFNLSGKVNIHLSNLNQESLNIKTEGIINIQSNAGYIKNLNIDGEGIGNFALKELKVKECKFNFEGMGNARLYLDGGELSGKISGMMNVDYYGTVSESSLTMEGMGKIKDHTD